jgi:hypothetical protein
MLGRYETTRDKVLSNTFTDKNKLKIFAGYFVNARPQVFGAYLRG